MLSHVLNANYRVFSPAVFTGLEPVRGVVRCCDCFGACTETLFTVIWKKSVLLNVGQLVRDCLGFLVWTVVRWDSEDLRLAVSEFVASDEMINRILSHLFT